MGFSTFRDFSFKSRPYQKFTVLGEMLPEKSPTMRLIKENVTSISLTLPRRGPTVLLASTYSPYNHNPSSIYQTLFQ